MGSQQIPSKFILKHSGLNPDKDVIDRVHRYHNSSGAVSGYIDSSRIY